MITTIQIIAAALLLPAIGYLIVATILFPPARRIAAWVIFFLLLLGVILLAAPWVFALVLWFIAIIVAIVVGVQYRQTERRALLWCLAVAAEKGISLSATARAFANERSDALGRQARRLAEDLERGMPLAVALENSYSRLPTDALVAIRAGCEMGDVGAALKDAARTDPGLDAMVHVLAAKALYFIGFALFGCAVVFFIQYKIVPEFIKIFEGFRFKLPPLTIVLVRMGSPQFFLLWLYGATASLVVFLGAIVRYVGFVRWDPPIVRRLWRRLDQAVVLRTLAQAVRQQSSLPAAVGVLAGRHPKGHVRRQLGRAAAGIGAGAHWCDSLRSAALLRPAEAGVLKSAERVGNLAWAMNEMADRGVRQFADRAAALMAVGYTLLLLAAGLVVMLIAAGVFLPLVDLIVKMT